MGNLISRKEMLKHFSDWQMELSKVGNEREWNLLDMIIRGVENQPTAFDLESVIAELKELKTYKLNMADAMSELMKRDKLGNYVCLEDVIEILNSAANATNGKIGG